MRKRRNKTDNMDKKPAKEVVTTHRSNMHSNITSLISKAAWGFTITACTYLGLIYLLLPKQLINVNQLSEEHVPKVIRPWILLLIKLLGLLYISVAGFVYLLGPNRVYFYLAAAAMNAVIIFLYCDALLQLKPEIFPFKNMAAQIGVASFQIILDLLAFVNFK